MKKLEKNLKQLLNNLNFKADYQTPEEKKDKDYKLNLNNKQNLSANCV